MTGPGWSVEVERRGVRDIDRLDPSVRERVLKAVARLGENPSGAQIRRLRNRPESRLRVGDWRVLFEVDRSTRMISIKRVSPREDAYRR